jgi:hypothetical protein
MTSMYTFVDSMYFPTNIFLKDFSLISVYTIIIIIFFYVHPCVKIDNFKIKNPKKKTNKPNQPKGKSHLASVRYVGDRGYPTRKSRVEELLDDKVRKDVNLMSYYLKNRRAASDLESGKS